MTLTPGDTDQEKIEFPSVFVMKQFTHHTLGEASARARAGLSFEGVSLGTNEFATAEVKTLVSFSLLK